MSHVCAWLNKFAVCSTWRLIEFTVSDALYEVWKVAHLYPSASRCTIFFFLSVQKSVVHFFVGIVSTNWNHKIWKLCRVTKGMAQVLGSYSFKSKDVFHNWSMLFGKDACKNRISKHVASVYESGQSLWPFPDKEFWPHGIFQQHFIHLWNIPLL